MFYYLLKMITAAKFLKILLLIFELHFSDLDLLSHVSTDGLVHTRLCWFSGTDNTPVMSFYCCFLSVIRKDGIEVRLRSDKLIREKLVAVYESVVIYVSYRFREIHIR